MAESAAKSRNGQNDGRGFRIVDGASGFGRQFSNELLDLTFGSVGRPSENRMAIGLGEVRGQKSDAAQVKASVSEHLEKDRVLPRRACNRDPQISFRFGQVQDLDTKREHGRTGRTCVQLALVDFTDVSDELGLDASGLHQKIGEPVEQFLVADGFQ